MSEISGSTVEASEKSENSESDEMVDFDRIKEGLLDCLNKIQTSGSVATSRYHGDFVNPGLTVSGTLIPLPLVPRDAETIKRACREAPFGRGDETVVDPSVRKTWELDNSQVEFANPGWEAYVLSLLDDAARSLSMTGVRGELYKLLLYEEGSFFKRHKDSEKVPGMIGTMVICLPSKHDGGSVHLSHGGRKYIFDTDKTSSFGLSCLSWFSDVTHEIKPLRSGYRLVLTYNLIHTGGVRISAGLVDKQSTILRSILTTWNKSPQEQSQLIYKLSHKYTQSSLSLDNLKGRDRAVCHSLYEVGLDCGFLLLLAKMTRTQSEYDDYGDGEADSTELVQVKTCDGGIISTSVMIEEEDILGSNLWNRRPDSEDEGDYTGNESMPATLRYHDTVAIIVPIGGLYCFDHSSNPRAIMKFVNWALNDKPYDERVQASIFALLKKTIMSCEPDGTVLSEVVAVAFKFQNRPLYREVIDTLLMDGNSQRQHKVLTTVAHLVREDFLRNQRQQPDWNFWLGDVTADMITPHPMTRFSEFFTRLEPLLQNEDLKSSLQAWKGPTLAKLVEKKRSFGMGDYDCLVDMLFSRLNDVSWLKDWFGPVIAKRGSKQLICAILQAIYSNREKGDARMLANATGAYQYLLERSVKKLALQIADFPKCIQPALVYGILREEESPLKSVTQVIDQGLRMGFSQQAIKILERSCTNIYEDCQNLKDDAMPYHTVVRSFLQSLLAVLANHRVPYLQSVKNMYVALLQNVLIVDPPKRPEKPLGWAHKPRYCSLNRACPDCRVLNAFLEDSDVQTRDFRMVETKRRHFQSQLPRHLFECQTMTNRTPYTLIVTKLGNEFRREMEHWRSAFSVFEDRVLGLRCEYMKFLLGEDLYEELILLKNLQDPDDAGQSGSARRKRKADEELDGSSASRPKLIE